ncbi:MAG TPA: hypothetical protein VFU41_01895 [Gemmatimonadales bacterium]|nr:hypothetical protein [Gemmatimonadales bacterium]
MRLSRPLVSGLFVVAACAKPAPQAAAGPNIVTITATDYAFGAPDTIPAGLTTFRMVNQGREPHQAVIAGASGRSWEELETAMKTEGPIPAWLTFPPGPAVVVAGDTSNATGVFAPGNYLIMCFIPSPDGQMHVMKGMFRRLVVTAPAPSHATTPAPEPPSDVTVTLSDYTFTLSAPLTAGSPTIRVENSGPQLHEVTIEQLAPGKTVADVQRWLAGGMKGEPPTKPVGGLIGPDVGKTGWFTVTLAPGNYLLTCYVPDAKDGRPHLVHGMMKEVTVS